MDKKIMTLLCSGLITTAASAQRFEDFFEENTLRIDYIFAGDHQNQAIYVDELNKTPQWAGRKKRLAELPLAGNGQLTVKDKATGQVIYRHSFSSLFQEWLGEEEATRTHKSFENCFQIPFPKAPVTVTVDLYGFHRNVIATYTHDVDPTDALIAHRGYRQTTPHKTVLSNGSLDECIDVVFVAEGYTQDEMDTFYKDVEIGMNSLFRHSGFKENKHKFNIIAVESVSAESGVSVPQKQDWKTTAVSSHFNTFYSSRYLTTLHLKDLNNILAGIPYEHIIILANTNEYGGGGIYNSYTLTTAHHPSFEPVVVHEFGHSFGGLGDEYYYDDHYIPTYPSDIEPWEKNLTTLVDFDSKWKAMLPEGTAIPTTPTHKPEDIYTKVGVYEGGGYTSKGVYRPVEECRMKVNNAPDFCPVCAKAVDDIIKFYTE
ncbi:MAG: peptidase M64 [Bacteroidaceae bacterium]|nr:peptidase M64 [Bacteroidaceae bacterium]